METVSTMPPVVMVLLALFSLVMVVMLWREWRGMNRRNDAPRDRQETRPDDR
ncbi:MAG: hypothetical protein K2X74_04390 [Acetobacteraceae bacterium]|nr:hypothetical protein [Acetobacteraceae bacterium]